MVGRITRRKAGSYGLDSTVDSSAGNNSLRAGTCTAILMRELGTSGQVDVEVEMWEHTGDNYWTGRREGRCKQQADV